MITGIACMQLVEQEKLALDDAAQTEKLCPELKDLQVLQPDRKLVPKKGGITLRMLLSHTSGCGYSFFHNGLRDHSKPIGCDEFSGHPTDLIQPLVHQPGEGWQYGVDIDFAGFCVERATGLSLNQYFKENIFEPLGLENISMFPNKQMKEELAFMNALEARDVLLNLGNTARSYQRCSMMANHQRPGAQILQKATVDAMFENQIPQFPDFGKQGIPPAKPDLTNEIPDLYPGEKQGWGLTFMISDGPTGRSNNTGHWAGLPNLFWWCDREKGVAGIIASQVLPFADAQVLELWVNFESGVYSGLS
ncbi:MAG: hypothetical protein M1830_007131 [Pleopsidium flavum]|nr:MAG: hypothetical protein M1830_007131 [Pleopsidium flavum]